MWGLVFRVQGSGLRVEGLELRVEGSGFRVREARLVRGSSVGLCLEGIQGYLVHKKGQTPLGPPYGPSHSSAVGS